MTGLDWERHLEHAHRAPHALPARRLACLIGGAIGDALGYRIEFDRWPEIERRYGPSGIQLAAVTGALYVSDDTQMSLFTLEGMTRASSIDRVVPEVREAYLDWLDTQGGSGARDLRGRLAHVPALRRTQAPGATCLAALRAGRGGSLARPINDRKGCGGVMRTAPLGFLPSLGDADVFRLGAEAAALTHGHPDGYLPAAAMAVLVRACLSQRPWANSIEHVLELARAWPGSEGTAQAISAAATATAEGVASRAIVVRLGQGWVGEEALAVGLYAAAVSSSFVQCVELAANHSGDSDSTASIAGQLWGARHGLTDIPTELTARVDVIDPLVSTWLAWERRAE